MGRNHRHNRTKTQAIGDTIAAPRALGIDIGRVIIKPGDTSGDTSFLHGSDADAMETPQNPRAFEVIGQLVEAFEGRVWLVSKCGPKIQRRTRRWLAHHQFFHRTGLTSRQLRFCLKRGDKAPICAELGLEAFIDDRADVLGPMAGIVPWRYLFGPQRRGRPPSDMIAVGDWAQVAARLLPIARERAVTADAPRSVAAPAR